MKIRPLCTHITMHQQTISQSKHVQSAEAAEITYDALIWGQLHVQILGRESTSSGLDYVSAHIKVKANRWVVAEICPFRQETVTWWPTSVLSGVRSTTRSSLYALAGISSDTHLESYQVQCWCAIWLISQWPNWFWFPILILIHLLANTLQPETSLATTTPCHCPFHMSATVSMTCSVCCSATLFMLLHVVYHPPVHPHFTWRATRAETALVCVLILSGSRGLHCWSCVHIS